MKCKNKILSITITLAFMVGVFFMPSIVQAQDVYKGVDVYEYSNISDYQKLKNSGTQVVIQKASEGLTYDDKLLNYRYTQLTKYGFKIGFYHFATNNGQPIAQAQHFLSRVKNLHADTVLWLDIENQPSWTKSQAVDFTNKFINYLQAQGYKVGVYTGLSFYYEYLQNNIPDNIPMWLASYGKQPLQFPAQVSWQYTDTGSVSGITGYADLDFFNNTIFPNNVPALPNSSKVKASPVVNSTIKSVQYNLNRVMNAGLTVDGIQGPKTTAVVNKFQDIMGLQVDGIAGVNTQAALNQILSFTTCKIGSNNYSTRYVQYRLSVSIDGIFGRQTKSVVQRYQSNNKLTGDGIVGPNTWKALFR